MPLDLADRGGDRHFARHECPHETPFVNGRQVPPVARPGNRDGPAELTCSRQRQRFEPDYGPGRKAHARIDDFDGHDRLSDHLDRRAEGADLGWSGAAGGRDPDGHAKLGFPFGDALDVAVLQRREAGLQVRENGNAPHLVAVGGVGNHFHVVAHRQGIPDLHDDLRRLRTHFRDPRPDLDRGRVAGCRSGGGYRGLQCGTVHHLRLRTGLRGRRWCLGCRRRSRGVDRHPRGPPRPTTREEQSGSEQPVDESTHSAWRSEHCPPPLKTRVYTAVYSLYTPLYRHVLPSICYPPMPSGGPRDRSHNGQPGIACAP